MATRLTSRGKFLAAALAGILIVVAAIFIGTNFFGDDSGKTDKESKNGTSVQQTGVPPLSAKRAAELETLLSSKDPKQQANAWLEVMRDDVASAIKDQDTYKLQVNTFNNKDTSGKKSVSGAVSATIDGAPGVISLVYIEDSTTAAPDGSWFVWKIEVN